MRDLYILLGFCLLIFLYAFLQGLGQEGNANSTTETIALRPNINSFPFDPVAAVPFVNKETSTQFYKTSRNLLFLFLLLFFVFNYLFIDEYFRQSQRENFGQDKLRLYRDLEIKTRKALQEKLAEKDRQLTVATVALEEKNKMLSGIKGRLNDLKKKSFEIIRHDLTPITYTIDRNLNTKEDWRQFQQHFSQLHPGFFDHLKKKFPHLRPNDLRICAYQRMNFTTLEIASLLHINQSSVQKARYRLKKKLSLNTNQSLDAFLASL